MNLLSEKKSTRDVNPAMFSLEILALSTATTAWTTDHPDYGLQTVLDWSQVHADPLYSGHFGHQLSHSERKETSENILPRWSAQLRSDNNSKSLFLKNKHGLFL